MTFKKIIGKLHLWLGLSSGIIVFIVSITGCIYAFEKEIQDAFQDFRFVEAKDQAYLLPSQLKSAAEKKMPGKEVHSVQYNPMGRAAYVSFYSSKDDYYLLAYLDPYSGEVLKVKDMHQDFFYIIKMLHYCLLLPIAIGQPIVATSTLFFVCMLITGIVLWWPRNKAAAKQRFWFRWKENLKWKRKTYDLHNILGFYACWIAIILALTGLVWGFEWYKNAYYGLFSGGKKLVDYYEPKSDTTNTAQTFVDQQIDKAYAMMLQENPKAQMFEVHVPDAKTAAISCATSSTIDTYWQYDFVYLDQYTLKEINVNHSYGRLKNASVADKIMRMNYDIHVGAIGGIAGKILAFIASLICASLPVTGFYIWWGRKKSAQKIINNA